MDTSSHIDKGSTSECCLACEEDGLDQEALCYCKECHKTYCHKCVGLHNQLYRKHTVLGREMSAQWAVVRESVETDEQCKDHTDVKLTMFCEDHDTLICHVCHLQNHKKCAKVVLISDKVQNMQRIGDFKKTIEKIQSMLIQLIQKKQDFEGNVERLQVVYEEVLKEINDLRNTIVDTINTIERNTVKELNKLLTTLKSSQQTEIDKCTIVLAKMQHIHDSAPNIDKGSETTALLLYRKYIEQSYETETLLSNMMDNNIPTITFSPDPLIGQTLTIPYLGKFMNPNTHLSVSSKETHEVMVKKDKEKCCITGICETVTGEFLIIDWNNKAVKLLDSNYKVISYSDLPDNPWFMSSIDPHLVAVTVNYHHVHVIRVRRGQLVWDRTLKFQHICTGIFHRDDKLLITSGTALFHYNVEWELVTKVYEDTSHRWTVTSCAVSPDGTRIYVADRTNNKLTTLSTDGTVISTLTDPAMQWGGLHVLPSLHVTEAGQVLVCGVLSDTIIQVDRDGRQILAQVVKRKDGVFKPTSVYYSKRTASLMVGRFKSKKIVVFKTK